MYINLFTAISISYVQTGHEAHKYKIELTPCPSRHGQGQVLQLGDLQKRKSAPETWSRRAHIMCKCEEQSNDLQVNTDEDFRDGL